MFTVTKWRLGWDAISVECCYNHASRIPYITKSEKKWLICILESFSLDEVWDVSCLTHDYSEILSFFSKMWKTQKIEIGYIALYLGDWSHLLKVFESFLGVLLAQSLVLQNNKNQSENSMIEDRTDRGKVLGRSRLNEQGRITLEDRSFEEKWKRPKRKKYEKSTKQPEERKWRLFFLFCPIMLQESQEL